MADILNNYRLLEPFKGQDAGFSRWTTAAKNGTTYFLKEFLDPKYPDYRLDESLRKTRIRECEAFEVEKRKLYSAINKASDGNLVRIAEFFRVDSHYYISMEWINKEALRPDDIAKMDMKDKLLLCRTAAHSLAALHSMNIAHSDIKETNVLVHRSVGGKPIAKIIDFDCSFFVESPPFNEDELGGDQVYLSPEACMFFCGEDIKLTCKMDIFALGLLFHQYITGRMPYFDKSAYDYAHEAVLDGNILEADQASVPAPVKKIIDRMLLNDPEERISAAEAYRQLTVYYSSFIKRYDAYSDNTKSSSARKGPADIDSSKYKDPGDYFKPAGEL